VGHAAGWHCEKETDLRHEQAQLVNSMDSSDPQKRPNTLRLTRRDHGILFGVLTLLVLRLWVLPLGGSLWLDETVTYWVASKGVAAAFTRSQFFPGQAALYNTIAALAIRFGGSSEICLRFPSLIATGLTAWLLFQLAKTWLDGEAGMIVVIVFASIHDVAIHAVSARPYGFALLSVVGAALALVRWLESGRLRSMLLFAVAGAAIIYFHYLFGAVYLVFLFYCVYARWSNETSVSWRMLLTAWVLIAALISPLLWNAVYTKRVSSAASFAPTPSLLQLFSSLLPALLGAGLMVGILIAVLVYRECWTNPEMPARSVWLLLMAWAFLPPIVLYLVARLTPFKTFVPRYFLEAVPALSLLVGWLVQTLQPRQARMIIAGVIAAISLLSVPGGLWHPMAALSQEDWRAAAASLQNEGISESTPVLVRTGLIETTKIRWNLNIDRESPLLCPLYKYPVPGKIILLPYELTPEAEDYFQSAYSEVLQNVDSFVLITRNYGGVSVISWFRGWLASKGFQASELGNNDGVSVLLFRRTPANTPSRAVLQP